MYLRRWSPALAVVVAIAAAGCGDQGTSTDPATIEGVTWTLTEFGDDQMANRAVVSTISLDDGRLTGNGGVNDITSTYEAGDDGSLSFGAVTATTKDGDSPAKHQETQLIKALEKVAQFEYDEPDSDDAAELDLKDASGRTLLQFVETS